MSTPRSRLESLIKALEARAEGTPFLLPHRRLAPLARDLRALLATCEWAPPPAVEPHQHGDEHKCARLPKGQRIYFSEGQREGREWWYDNGDDDVCVVACPFCGERLQ